MLFNKASNITMHDNYYSMKRYEDESLYRLNVDGVSFHWRLIIWYNDGINVYRYDVKITINL